MKIPMLGFALQPTQLAASTPIQHAGGEEAQQEDPGKFPRDEPFEQDGGHRWLRHPREIKDLRKN
jgi:hypothetical protein